MSFQEKNVAVTLANFSLILLFFLVRVFQLIRNDNFTPSAMFRVWVTVIVIAVFVTIAATILTHIVSAIIEVIQTGNDEPEIEDFEDERDKLIDLRGTQLTYSITSFGSFIAMLTFALGQPPLTMFSLLILFGLIGQIAGDTRRLRLYRGGM